MLNKIITYIQNEVFNYLTSFTMALTSMVSCSPLNLTTLFISYCFNHVMFKATLCTTNDSKFVVTWLKWAWSKLKVPYRIPSPRLKSLSKVCRDGKTHASMLFFLLKYSRHLSKHILIHNWLFSEILSNISMLFSYVLGSKWLFIYFHKCLSIKCGQ